jgi:SNF2 family DNA or RNA helicase
MAGLVVYYSNTNNLEHRDQSEERASGVGKTERVTVVDLITRGTVEEKIVASLRNKIDLAAAITGDEWREWII